MNREDRGRNPRQFLLVPELRRMPRSDAHFGTLKREIESKVHMHSPGPSRRSRPLRGRDYRGSRQEPPTSVLPEGTLSAFCEFPVHQTTALPRLEPSTPDPSFPTLRAARVGYYPGSGLAVAAAAATTTRRRLRSSRAAPARLSCCHRTCHGTCLKPSSAPRPAWLAMSTAPRRVRPHGSRRHYRSVMIRAVDAHDVPLRGW